MTYKHPHGARSERIPNPNCGANGTVCQLQSLWISEPTLNVCARLQIQTRLCRCTEEQSRAIPRAGLKKSLVPTGNRLPIKNYSVMSRLHSEPRPEEFLAKRKVLATQALAAISLDVASRINPVQYVVQSSRKRLIPSIE